MIRLDRVSRRWPDFAIRDVSLDVADGEYLVIVGPTGAGKTLLLELLLGIHHPDEGRIFIGGKDVTDSPPETRGIGMVYQDYVIFPHLTVEQNLGFGLRYRPLSKADGMRKVRETAALLGIEHLLHRYQNTLSGGEKQRVAIGRALVTEPRVLLLDEPLSALDRRTSRRLRSELKTLHESSRLTILHVTHDLSEARQMGGRIALINDGELNAIGSSEELMRRPPNIFAANFFGAVNLFEGTLENRCGETWIVVGPIAAPVPSGDGERCWLMVHPDEVLLLPRDENAPQHAVKGQVTGLVDEGGYIAVTLDVDNLGESLIVYTGRQAVRSLCLQLGTPVVADLSHAIHVL